MQSLRYERKISSVEVSENGGEIVPFRARPPVFCQPRFGYPQQNGARHAGPWPAFDRGVTTPFALAGFDLLAAFPLEAAPRLAAPAAEPDLEDVVWPPAPLPAPVPSDESAFVNLLRLLGQGDASAPTATESAPESAAPRPRTADVPIEAAPAEPLRVTVESNQPIEAASGLEAAAPRVAQFFMDALPYETPQRDAFPPETVEPEPPDAAEPPLSESESPWRAASLPLPAALSEAPLPQPPVEPALVSQAPAQAAVAPAALPAVAPESHSRAAIQAAVRRPPAVPERVREKASTAVGAVPAAPVAFALRLRGATGAAPDQSPAVEAATQKLARRQADRSGKPVAAAKPLPPEAPAPTPPKSAATRIEPVVTNIEPAAPEPAANREAETKNDPPQPSAPEQHAPAFQLRRGSPRADTPLPPERSPRPIDEAAPVTPGRIQARIPVRELEAAPPAPLAKADAVPVEAPSGVRAAGPARIAVRIDEAGAPAVDVHVAARGVQVRVAVRTADVDLRSALRQELNSLVDSLANAGFHAEVAAPEFAALAAAEPTSVSGARDFETARSTGQADRGERDRGRDSGREQHAQQQPGHHSRERHPAPRVWAEMMEAMA